MVCVCEMMICSVCKVETLNKLCISDQSVYLEYVAHLIITQRCKYIIYPLSCWDKSRIFPLSLFCEAPTWMPRPARALWTSWVDKQAAVIQQEWLRLRVVTGGWQTESYHRCPRFARHPVLSWISLPKTKMKVNPQHHRASNVCTCNSNGDESCTHSVTFGARRTPLSLEDRKLECQTARRGAY